MAIVPIIIDAPNNPNADTLYVAGNKINANEEYLDQNKIDSTDPIVVGGTITEKVYSLTGLDIDPANGSIQYKTIAANTTFTATNFSDGQCITLRLVDGDSYTVVWPTIKWVGTLAPTLTSEDVVVLWAESSLLYGKYIGAL